MNYSSQDIASQGSDIQTKRISEFTTRVFSFMFFGLAVTAGVAHVALEWQPLFQFAIKSYWFLIIAKLGLVFYLSSRITKMSAQTALGCFLFYSAMMGLTLTPLLYAYTQSSVVSAFFISSAMFGGMALWGFTTKKDLTSLGGLCSMGLWGIIIASIVNIFIGHSGFSMIISYITVGVFIGLTAWDAQKLKTMALYGGGDRMAIYGALQLYLDFIILFVHILNILGVRRD